MERNIMRFNFSELVMGQSDEITIEVKPEDIDKFCQLSGDRSPIHTDEAFAKKQGFQGRIAHGMLIGAYISQFIGNHLPGSYGILQSMDLEFRKPLCPPVTLKIKGKIIGLSQAVGQVVIKIEVVDGKGSLFATAKVSSVMKRESK